MCAGTRAVGRGAGGAGRDRRAAAAGRFLPYPAVTAGHQRAARSQPTSASFMAARPGRLLQRATAAGGDRRAGGPPKSPADR